MADSLTPPTFSGSSEEDVQVWIKQFEQFCVFKKLNNDQKLASIGLLLRGQAAVWYHGLPADITADLNTLKEKLVGTYSLSRNALWQKERQLFNRLQGPTESVNDYITTMRASCRDLDVSEAQLVRLICGGLREELRPFILGKNLQTVDEVITAATQIESATPSSRDSKLLAEIKELRAEVANLRNQAVSVAAIPSQEAIQRPRSPSPFRSQRDRTLYDRRRVTFREGPQQLQHKLYFQRDQPCQGCGKLDHARINCFAKHLQCRFCGRYGHIASVCKSARNSSYNK